MQLFQQNSSLDKNIFLRTENQELTYEQVFSLGDTLFESTEKQVILILCKKSINTIVAYVGALRNNKVPLLLDANLNVNLINGFINKYHPNYICCTDDSGLMLDGYSLFKSFGSLLIFKKDAPCGYEINNELAILVPTSGSTGDPKCVRISHNNIYTCTQAICEYLKFSQHRVCLSILPIHYSYGLSVLHNCIYERACYVVSDVNVLDKAFWRILTDFSITDLSGVPFTFKVLKRATVDYKDFPNLQCVTQAGGYMPEADTKFFQERFADTGISYFSMYGQTEASPRISYLAPEYAFSKHGSVGVPLSCGKVSLLDTDANGVGELCYEGPNVALGYAEGYQDLARGDEFKGKLKTGDLAQIDEDGFIRIMGRLKRFIKLAGISVNLDRIEKDLNGRFNSVVVIGKDEKIIALTEGDNSAEIKSFIASTYGFNKANIKSQQISSVPLNASGKTDYKQLTQDFC